MLYVIYQEDGPDSKAIRAATKEAHLAYLDQHEDILVLGGATLAEVAANFERRTGRRVVLADPALGRLRVGGRFRADDVEGFASVLATTLEIEVEPLANGELRLRKKDQHRDSGK